MYTDTKMDFSKLRAADHVLGIEKVTWKTDMGLYYRVLKSREPQPLRVGLWLR